MPFFDYFKVTAENNLISKNKFLIMFLITAIFGAGSVHQTIEIEAQKIKGIKAIYEVSEGFQAVISGMERLETKPKVKPQTIIRKEIVKEITKQVVIDCTRCEQQLNEIIDKKIGARHD